MGRKSLKQKDGIQEVKKEVGTERQNPRDKKRVESIEKWWEQESGGEGL